MLLRILAFLAVIILTSSLGTAARAEGVILTVTIGGETKTYDRQALESLGLETIKTATIWTEGVQEFQGVPLYLLTDAIGAETGTLLATAINDYTVEIPLSDATEGGPILAMRMNGEIMSLRDKGPLWVIYPYDQNAAYRSEVTYSRSIWQLDRIEVTQ
jgi:hypothetical protein